MGIAKDGIEIEAKGKVKETEATVRGDVGKAMGDTSEELKGSRARGKGKRSEEVRDGRAQGLTPRA